MAGLGKLFWKTWDEEWIPQPFSTGPVVVVVDCPYTARFLRNMVELNPRYIFKVVGKMV